MSRKNIITICFSGMVMISVFLIFISDQFADVSSSTPTLSDNYAFNDGWSYMVDNGTHPLEALPTQIPMNIDEELILTNTLPDLTFTGNALCFRSSNQSIYVYVDDELIYDFDIHKQFILSNTNGCGWHFINLPVNSSGKEIKIILSTHYEISTGFISYFELNDPGTLIIQLVKENAFGISICLFTVFIGFLLILFSFISINKKIIIHGIGYLGMVAILVSIFSLLETLTVSLVYGKTAILEMISYLVLIIIPVPMLLFIKTSYYPDEHKIIDTLCILSIINFILSVILQILHIVDFPTSSTFSHLLLVVTSVSILFISIRDFIKNKNSYSLVLSLSVLQIFLFLVFDLVRYYYLDTFTDYAKAFRVGFLIFILMLAIHYIYRVSSLIEKGLQAEFYKRMAYEDIMTKCKNRTYFEKELAESQLRINEYKNLIIVTFDLNNLKNTNDQYGHKAGDDLLCSCASIISESFKPFGVCSRIGGDEFAVIIRNFSVVEVESAVIRMKQLVDVYNKEHSYSLQIAYGYAEWNSNVFRNLEALLSRADKMMYQRKNKMKQKLNTNEGVY